jgi:hypothetical protein
MYVAIIDTFPNVMPLRVDMFGASMETGIFGKSKGSFIVREERSGSRLRQIDLGSKHTEPHALASGFGTSNVFSIACGLSYRFLFARSPGDHAVTE